MQCNHDPRCENRVACIRLQITDTRSRMEEISATSADEFTEELDAEYAELEERLADPDDESRGLLATLEREQRRARLQERAEQALASGNGNATERGDDGPPNVNVRTDDPFDLSGVAAYGEARNREIRSRALSVIEESGRFVEDSHREAATRIVERNGSQPGLAELVLLRSSETYADAFLRAAFDPDAMSTEERESLRQVKELQRAMSLSDVTGTLVPAHLDPSLIVSNDGTVNPFRGVARVESGVTNVYQTVSSAGITASYDAEAAEVSDDAPSFSNPKATAFKAAAFVPISIEAFEDARGRESEIVMLIQDAKDRLESARFATGNGTSAPRGLITALDANTNVEVNTTTTNVFGLVDVYNLYEQLPARWRNERTTWFANLAIINDIRQFGTNSLSTQTVDLTADGITRILGKRVLESSEMDGTLTQFANDNILVVGDPQQFLIYDRIGLSVELIPHLFHTSNNRPSGQRGWYAHWRSGSNTTVDTAFRVLQADTAS